MKLMPQRLFYCQVKCCYTDFASTCQHRPRLRQRLAGETANIKKMIWFNKLPNLFFNSPPCFTAKEQNSTTEARRKVAGQLF
jgi:hypothetical protein